MGKSSPVFRLFSVLYHERPLSGKRPHSTRTSGKKEIQPFLPPVSSLKRGFVVEFKHQEREVRK